jgi:hypothetical protein
MTKHLLAVAAAGVLSSGVALAQPYPAAPGTRTVITTHGPEWYGDHWHGDRWHAEQLARHRYIVREGIAGSSTVRKVTRTNPYTGTTTTRTTVTHD